MNEYTEREGDVSGRKQEVSVETSEKTVESLKSAGNARNEASRGLNERQRDALSGFFEHGVSTQEAIDRAVRAGKSGTPESSVPETPGDGLPSAEDLDAVEAEKEAAARAAGER